MDIATIEPQLKPDRRECTSQRKMISSIGFIAMDVVINIYFTVRLVQILRRADRIKHNKLFSAVLQWNYVRVCFASGVTVLAVFNLLLTDSIKREVFFTLTAFICIGMSYVISVDDDIVRSFRHNTEKNLKIECHQSQKREYLHYAQRAGCLKFRPANTVLTNICCQHAAFAQAEVQ